jgi:hypothetical protein
MVVVEDKSLEGVKHNSFPQSELIPAAAQKNMGTLNEQKRKWEDLLESDEMLGLR